VISEERVHVEVFGKKLEGKRIYIGGNKMSFPEPTSDPEVIENEVVRLLSIGVTDASIEGNAIYLTLKDGSRLALGGTDDDYGNEGFYFDHYVDGKCNAWGYTR